MVLIVIKLTLTGSPAQLQLCLLFSPPRLAGLSAAISNFNWVQRSVETFVWHQQQTVSGLFENDYYELRLGESEGAGCEYQMQISLQGLF